MGWTEKGKGEKNWDNFGITRIKIIQRRSFKLKKENIIHKKS